LGSKGPQGLKYPQSKYSAQERLCAPFLNQYLPVARKVNDLQDIMLPGMDGMEICLELRKFSAVPILMLTARVDEIDRVVGLELGAY